MTGEVLLNGSPEAGRPVSLYQNASPAKAISAVTDAAGGYRLNVYDLEYFHGVPVTYESSAYTVTVTDRGEQETGGTNSNAFLTAVKGYLTSFLSLFTSHDTTPPTVIPPILPTGRKVALQTVIVINFSKQMDQATTEGAVTLTGGRAVPPLTFDWQLASNETRSVLRLMPGSDLERGTDYTVKVARTARDTVGNYLDDDYLGQFTTLSTGDVNVTPPEVLSVTPADGSTNVAVDPSLAILFSEAMSLEAAEQAVTLALAGSSVHIPLAWSWVGSKMICTPGSNLAANASYKLTIGAGACDLAGNPLANPQSAVFSTAGAAVDTTPPEVIAVTGGRDVALNASTVIYFSQAMDPLTITTANIEARDSAGRPLAAAVTWNPATNSATLTPEKSFDSYADYTIIVYTRCTNRIGIHLRREYRTTLQTTDVAGPVIRKVKFDGRGYAPNDVISASAVISAEVSDPSGVDYNNITLKLGPGLTVQRSGFKAQDVYANGVLKYQVAPALAEGAYLITLEALDAKGNLGSWTGQVRVFTGEVVLVPGRWRSRPRRRSARCGRRRRARRRR